MDQEFDFAAYLRRIGLGTAPRGDLAGVFSLHRAHVAAIPFENLDIQFGLGVRLDAVSLQDALVHRRRGGYCFQQNSLFAMALRAIDVPVETCEARVRMGGPGLLPRTHMVLTIRAGTRNWLADVGFGGDGLTGPVAMDGAEVEQEGRTYRVAEEGHLRVLQTRAGDRWQDLYAILPDPVHPIDFEMANWYTSTWPRSPFVQTVTAQRVTQGARHILRNLTYTVSRGNACDTREIERAELVPLLRSVFDLDVPLDSRFTALDGTLVQCGV